MMYSRHTYKGMTLIEVLIVVAIITIIAAIALPSYQNSVRKSRRADAYNILNEVMQAQERYYVNNTPHTYTTLLATDLGFSVEANIPSDEGWYLVSAGQCADGSALTQCVQLTATAQGDQASDDVANGGPDLTLNSRGTKTPNATGWWGR